MLWCAILGACLASFIPCYSERRRFHLPQFDHSRCLHCHEPISIIYLIPFIGYLFTKGRCMHCHSHISLSYPCMEFVGTLTGVLLYWRYENVPLASFLLLICALLLLMSLDDAAEQMIHDADLLILAILSLIYVICFSSAPLIEHIIGILFISFPLLCVKLVRPEALGSGDILFMAITGLELGYLLVSYAFLLSMLFALIIAVMLLITRKATRYTSLPLVPFLSTGVYVMQFFLLL